MLRKKYEQVPLHILEWWFRCKRQITRCSKGSVRTVNWLLVDCFGNLGTADFRQNCPTHCIPIMNLNVWSCISLQLFGLEDDVNIACMKEDVQAYIAQNPGISEFEHLTEQDVKVR